MAALMLLLLFPSWGWHIPLPSTRINILALRWCDPSLAGGFVSSASGDPPLQPVVGSVSGGTAVPYRKPMLALDATLFL